jgi:hypothetical protein
MRIFLGYLAALVVSYALTLALSTGLLFMAVLFLGPPIIAMALLARWAWRRLSEELAAKVAAEVLRQAQAK